MLAQVEAAKIREIDGLRYRLQQMTEERQAAKVSGDIA